jgi:hypothetical protein
MDASVPPLEMAQMSYAVMIKAKATRVTTKKMAVVFFMDHHPL